MFGFGKTNRVLKDLNARNSHCASIFHALATPLTEAQSGETSENQITNNEIADTLNSDFQKTRDALKIRDLSDIAATTVIQHIEIVEKTREKMLDSFGSNRELMEFGGAFTAVGTCRRLVFAVAPALGKNQQETKVHTVALLDGLEKSGKSLLVKNDTFTDAYIEFVSTLREVIVNP